MGRPRKVVSFTEAQVAVPLSEKDQHLKARQLADLCDEVDRERAAAKADAAGARKKIRQLEDRRRLLAECVRTGSEKQNAQVELFRPPKPTRAQDDAATEAFEAAVERTGLDERDAFLANKSATVPPPQPATTADFADAWDAPVADVTVPENAAAKGSRKKKNGKPDDAPPAA